MNKKKSVLFWVIAFVLTLVIAVYQRMTGPTYPISSKDKINGINIKYRFLRSHVEFEKMPVQITVHEKNVEAFLYYRRFKTKDDWTEVKMIRDKDTLEAFIPGQPTAGKMEYSVRISVDQKSKILNEGKSIVVRFRGKVPAIFLILHVIFMFLGILFALRTGMEALRKDGNYFWMVNWTLGIIFVGGMILGPIVQQFAFGDLWTGFPFGFDLTDSKTLAAFILWMVAFLLKKKNKFWVLLATVVMIIVYLIPHSVLGSELDYETGKMRHKFGVTFIDPDTIKKV